MKKIKYITVAVLLLLATVFSLASCGGKYHVNGLHYTLGKDFEHIKVTYSENCYYDGHAYFYFNVYSHEGIEETLGFDGDITVEDYTKKFCALNGLPVVYEYDTERDRTIIKCHARDFSLGSEPVIEEEFYYFTIFRGTAHLYIVTMSAPDEMRAEYEPMFDGLVRDIWAD